MRVAKKFHDRSEKQMTAEIAGLFGIILMLVLIFLKIWIGAAMGILGFLGYAYLDGWDNALLMIGMEPYSQTAAYTLSAIPLFLLMGSVISASGIGEDLYVAVRKWIGHVRGGLAMATVGASGMFAAICGDSVATAVTMGKIAFPEMKKHKYDDKLAVGSIVAGGTIGIMIPPSLGFILYGLLTEQSIGQLFIAGIIPGITQVLIYMLAIYIACRINPDLGPPVAPVSLKEKVTALKVVWPMIIHFLTIIGGIYAGIFTPSEAGAIGAFGAIVLGLALRRLRWAEFRKVFEETAASTSMIIFLLVGAFILMRFLSISQVTAMLSDFIVGINAPRILILTGIVIFYLIIGCFLNSLTAIVLTLPIFYPVILGLGYDPIWFGVIVVRVIEIGMISPPFGMNAFVISKTTNTPIGTVFKGVIPFIMADLVHLVFLVVFPEVSLFLVRMMN